jgi:hypothetical protein
MQAMLDHKRCDRRDLDHLMTQGIWINTVQHLTAAAAGIRGVTTKPQQRMTPALHGGLRRPPFLMVTNGDKSPKCYQVRKNSQA